jgi:hypothetical protein
MQHDHELDRFGLAADERPEHYAAFANSMEGLFTHRRFIYRDGLSGESWSIPFGEITSVKVSTSGLLIRDGWDWFRRVHIWLADMIDPLEDGGEYRAFGDITIDAKDVEQAHDIGRRLAAAMIAAHPNIGDP